MFHLTKILHYHQNIAVKNNFRQTYNIHIYKCSLIRVLYIYKYTYIYIYIIHKYTYIYIYNVYNDMPQLNPFVTNDLHMGDHAKISYI